MLYYDSNYNVLICRSHKHAVRDLGWHLRIHGVSGREREALLTEYGSRTIRDPRFRLADSTDVRSWLADPVEGYLCARCNFMTRKYMHLLMHWEKAHYDLHNAPRPTFAEPRSHAKCIWMQTLYPSPFIRWFAVEYRRGSIFSERHEKMPVGAEWRPEFLNDCIHNLRETYKPALLGMPREIRDMIYELVLTKDATYHIEDILGPVEPEFGGGMIDDEHDLAFGTLGDRKKPYDFRKVAERDLEAFYRNGQPTKLRAVMLSSHQKQPVNLLRTCFVIYLEAAEFFYTKNRFFIHMRWQNFMTAIHFLTSLRPQTRNHIRDLGIKSLRPPQGAEKPWEGPSPKQALLYYFSMREFLRVCVPSMSLKSIVLCFNLQDIDEGGHLSPRSSTQSPWLNPFLRLSTASIEIRIASFDFTGYETGTGTIDTSAGRLVDKLCVVDRLKCIKGRWGHGDDYGGDIYAWWNRVLPKKGREIS
ncbi:uncharacterized protein KY384_002205 [Bacidia gigantensis]|uniref:uncharacterized protein n=1 Tax=Bacidia gigantensis TaxID=2732470 RepID=UPI001D057631|nr:uncharacterized protein KY384_002205 [Bacidia gigantensis]KAG8533422.1 hypothetical protein KY384_002205 [Bacidia gigantensis]